MIIAETPRLTIRNWQDGDRALFFEINSDPAVMEFFPNRRTRTQSDAFMEIMRERIGDTGYGFYALALRETGEPIGFCGLNPAWLEPFLPAGSIEVGWRLAHRFWGMGYASEAARRLLEHGFERENLGEIVSFALHDNRRSIAVMKRIGLQRQADLDFDHPRIPASHPHLSPHAVYALTCEQWRAGY